MKYIPLTKVTADYSISWERESGSRQMFPFREGYAVSSSAGEVGGGRTRYSTVEDATAAAHREQAAHDQRTAAAVVAAAEAIAVAAAPQLTPTAATPIEHDEPRATERQVAYIQRLQRQRHLDGNTTSGFLAGIPTTTAGLRALSVSAASSVISSLREEY